VLKLAVLIAGLVLAAAIAWDAGERHYDNCVHKAEARTPIRTVQSGSIIGPRQTVMGLAARRRAVDGCSRLPF
jgi:hypothetical protein